MIVPAPEIAEGAAGRWCMVRVVDIMMWLPAFDWAAMIDAKPKAEPVQAYEVSIPSYEALAKALKRHLRRLHSPYVFCNSKGQPYDNVNTAVRNAAKRAGIPDRVGLHQLRHAFCSHA